MMNDGGIDLLQVCFSKRFLFGNYRGRVKVRAVSLQKSVGDNGGSSNVVALMVAIAVMMLSPIMMVLVVMMVMMVVVVVLMVG